MAQVHIMFDFETLGVRQIPAFGSCGLVVFNPFKVQSMEEIKQGEAKLVYLRLQAAIEAGLKVDENTLRFWLQTHKDLLTPALMAQSYHEAHSTIGSFGSAIKNWCQYNAGLGEFQNNDARWWCKGADFDGAMLKYVQDRTEGSNFVNYNEVRDVRTVFDLAWGDTKPKFVELSDIKPHNPMDDCHFQIYALQRALAKLNVPAPV